MGVAGRVDLWRAASSVDRTVGGDALALFSFLLAFGIITHHHPGSLTSDWDTPFVPITLAFAVGLLIWPRTTVLLLGLFAAIIGDVVVESPFHANHFLLVALIALVTLPLMAVPVLRDDRSTVQRRLFPVVRTAVACTYLLAAFQKLNSGFFDPVLGCGMDHFRLFAETINIPIPHAAMFGSSLAFGTIGAEIAIPLLLIPRRTRVAGLILGMAFHYAMAANGHPAFSALALAWYVPFLPAEVVGRMAQRVQRHEAAAWLFRLIAITGIAIVGLGGILHLTGIDLGSSLTARVPYLLLAPGVVALTAISWRNWDRTARPAPRAGATRPAAPMERSVMVAISAAVLGLIVLAALPYLGIRTQGALSMFSNLRTEHAAGYWNHLIVPSAAHVASANDIWVEPLDDHPLVFRSLEVDKEPAAVNLFEVRRALAEACPGDGPLALRYREMGTTEVVSLSDACTTELAQPLPLLERKLIWFRPILEPNACSH